MCCRIGTPENYGSIRRKTPQKGGPALDGTDCRSVSTVTLATTATVRRACSMSLVTILLIILIILAFGGGGFLGGGAYRGPGFGLGGILLLVLIVLLVTGRLL